MTTKMYIIVIIELFDSFMYKSTNLYLESVGKYK